MDSIFVTPEAVNTSNPGAQSSATNDKSGPRYGAYSAAAEGDDKQYPA